MMSDYFVGVISTTKAQMRPIKLVSVIHREFYGGTAGEIYGEAIYGEEIYRGMVRDQTQTTN